MKHVAILFAAAISSNCAVALGPRLYTTPVTVDSFQRQLASLDPPDLAHWHEGVRRLDGAIADAAEDAVRRLKRAINVTGGRPIERRRRDR